MPPGLPSLIDKEEKQLRSAVVHCLDDQCDLDYNYIVETLKESKRQHVPRIAAILRKGILDGIDEGVDDEEDLDEKITKWRNLRSNHLMNLLEHLVPELTPHRNHIKSLGRPTLLKWILYGLNVKENQEGQR